MSSRDQSTPPFNSPYQPALKSTTMIHSPAYPSPARSYSELSKYPADGLGPHNYSQSFAVSRDPSDPILYPPSPQSTEAWTHLSTRTSPLITEAPVDPWTPAYEAPVSRPPLPWAPHDMSHRSSFSSSRDMSIFLCEGSEHAFPPIKLEAGSEWATDDEPSPPSLRHHQPITVSPDRLTRSIFPYDHLYGSPPIPKFEPAPQDGDLQVLSYEGRHRSPQRRNSVGGVTQRTRIRRNPTTAENANFQCKVCGKLFQRRYHHKMHLQTHNPTRKKEHICPHKECEKQFVRKTDLDRHTNSVSRIHILLFSICTDSFSRHEEDSCPKRNELRDPNILPQRASIRAGPNAQLPYYHSP
ncbi:hypothetical protein K469DRAFT_701328 [Zopfia rhizophila CBS 207.26]|uniref:C2H2-type domain-containing protein n=1 Tax=Zopfia rhizophila CBS 207.26 TaxID=1314779 RepID=A0A6A6DBP3_9PEZI|nr:hypothetical protein K469DRAFT_701328 [Zopfia rhizophila CBS 207.26]